MATVLEHIGEVQRKLDFPSYPGDGIIGEALLNVIDEKVTQANMARQPWFMTRATLTTNVNQVEYSIDELGASKLRYVYALDTTVTYPRRYPYEIVPYESLTTWYHAGDYPPVSPQIATYSPFASRPDRACATFYDSDTGETKLEITPTPTTNFQIVVIAEPDLQRPQTKNDVAFRFEQFKGFVTDCTALRLLTVTRWEGMQRQDWPLKRKELAGSVEQGYGLVADAARGERLYFLWRHSGKNAGGLRAIGWARDRL